MINHDNHIGLTISKLRTEKGISEAELAKVLGIKAPAMNLIENGKRGINADKIIKICRYFHVSADYLLGLCDAETTETASQDDMIEEGLLENYTLLTPANRYRLLAESLDLLENQREEKKAYPDKNDT